ncbi:DDE-type integrase/transposase/recombinase [Fibrella sp. HMF5335]|uniref:DDE-type integrase/transposase/recombinase n=1 Tax=Fibrella rubiginis TaxID=2817060 RepID=A0A939G9T3_9BACT|nr:DDE-type integrase/transposase/recombinase [Fibrella rubiginis]MBO0935097.1 DDE-type integrase/transposase/recombinase [Fibrella rubiginis]
MNKLPIAKRSQIIQLLVEGTSLRATSQIADVSINTVTKLLVDVGAACQQFHDDTVINVTSQRVQCDEIWSFVYAKAKNVEEATAAPEGAGDVWTWTGLDADAKLIISWYVGNRDAESALDFMQDVKSRVANRIQLTTDGHKPHLKAVDTAFDGEVYFAQLVKIYGSPEGTGNEKWYSSAEFTGTKKVIIEGRPDEKHISTSFVERQNLTMRMHMRRFTRFTNGFSKKIESHCHAIALHFVYYNFCKVHKTLRVTPAMEAKLADRPMSIQQLVELTD